MFPKPGSKVVFYAFEEQMNWATTGTGLGNATKKLFRAQNRVGILQNIFRDGKVFLESRVFL